MSACQDRVIRIYEHRSLKKIKEIQARNIGWSIIDTDYSPDQRWLIYSSWSECSEYIYIYYHHIIIIRIFISIQFIYVISLVNVTLTMHLT